MNTDTYEVLALKYAERNNRARRESFIFADDHTSPHPMDYFVWVVRNHSRTLVVDTGYDRDEGARRDRPVLANPREVLAKVGVDAAEVGEVVITHLHYDHAGSLDHFPKAKFHLQEAEMAYATGPCMCHGDLQYAFSADHVVEMVRHVYAGRVRFHDGEAEIAPGISVHQIGGHTRGLQSVRVKTQRGYVVLASDASHYYENFQTRKFFPIVVDVEAMMRGFDKLESLADSPHHIIPGHDPLVRQYYPPLRPDLSGIVHRLDVDPAA